MSEFEIEEPSALLRFVKRDGAYILQQTIMIKKFTTEHANQIGQRNVWRDVPLVEANVESNASIDTKAGLRLGAHLVGETK